MCAPYVEGQEGRRRPVAGVDRCPQAVAGEVCSVGRHGWRERKTGPGFALRILHCRVHGVHFTVYPPGHVPYGREAVAPVDERGQVPVTAEEGAESWQGTMFRGSAGGRLRRALAA